jgi:hypothetical protein
MAEWSCSQGHVTFKNLIFGDSNNKQQSLFLQFASCVRKILFLYYIIILSFHIFDLHRSIHFKLLALQQQQKHA